MAEVRGPLTSRITPVLQSHTTVSIPFVERALPTSIASLEFVTDIEGIPPPGVISHIRGQLIVGFSAAG